MTLYLKALRSGRRGTHTDFVWPLGEWVEVDGDLVACENGLHTCSPAQIFAWFSEELWLVEVDPAEVMAAGSKTVVRRARLVRRLAWDERSARLFAADCAERVLHLFERERPHDDRPRRAIDVARRFARGEATTEELAAARAAARAAVWDAARAVVGDAARAAAADAAADAAGAAAADVTRAAAGAAARAVAGAAAADAAGAAERAWQVGHLLTVVGVTDGERERLVR